MNKILTMKNLEREAELFALNEYFWDYPDDLTFDSIVRMLQDDDFTDSAEQFRLSEYYENEWDSNVAGLLMGMKRHFIKAMQKYVIKADDIEG